MPDEKLTDLLIQYIYDITRANNIEYDYYSRMKQEATYAYDGKKRKYAQRIADYTKAKIDVRESTQKEIRKILFMANSEHHNKSIMQDWEKHYSEKGKVISFAVFLGESGGAEIIRHPQITDAQLRKLLADGLAHIDAKIKKTTE